MSSSVNSGACQKMCTIKLLTPERVQYITSLQHHHALRGQGIAYRQMT